MNRPLQPNDAPGELTRQSRRIFYSLYLHSGTLFLGSMAIGGCAALLVYKQRLFIHSREDWVLFFYFPPVVALTSLVLASLLTRACRAFVPPEARESSGATITEAEWRSWPARVRFAKVVDVLVVLEGALVMGWMFGGAIAVSVFK